MRAHEVGVGGVRRGRGVRHEVVDLRLCGLPVAVDAADALLQPRRVERDVEVDQPVAVGLQVDAFTGGVGGQQHPHRFLGRVRGELRADVLTILGRRRALDDGQPVGVAALGQHPLQPVDGVGVLGEHHDALVGPVLAVGSAHRVEERDERFQAGVGAALVAQSPLRELLELARAWQR